MKKSFHAYKGILLMNFVYSFPVIFILFYTLKIVPILFIEREFLLGLIALFINIILLILLVPLLRNLTYRLVVDGDYLVEKGIFRETRQVEISKIKAVTAAYHYLGTGRQSTKEVKARWLLNIIILLLSSRGGGFTAGMPMLNFKGEGIRKFPAIPVNPKIMYVLLEKNPDLLVDHDLKDLLPSGICRKLGIKRTWVDVIGLFLGHFFYTILACLLIIIVSFFIFGLTSQLFIK